MVTAVAHCVRLSRMASGGCAPGATRAMATDGLQLGLWMLWLEDSTSVLEAHIEEKLLC